MMTRAFASRVNADSFVREHRDDEQHHEDDALDLEADLGDPVEQRRCAVAVSTERCPAHHERGGARLGSWKARPPEERVEEVADDDRQDRLAEREPEVDDQRPVYDELDVPDRSGPQPEEAGWLHRPFGVGDQLDSALFELERLVAFRGRCGV